MPPPAYPRLSPQAVILAERIARRAGADHVRVDFMTHDVGLAGVGLGGSLVFGELTFTTVRTPAPPLTSPSPPKLTTSTTPGNVVIPIANVPLVPEDF